MIRFEHSKRGTMIEASGDLQMLCAEVALMTKLLYEQLEREDVKTEFRENMQRMMESDSPTWEERKISDAAFRSAGFEDFVNQQKEAGSGDQAGQS